MTMAQIESPSRWSAVPMGLASVLGLFALLVVLLLMLRQVAHPPAFAADEVYLNLAAARNLHQLRFLGLDVATNLPATTDTLWQLLLTFGQRLPLSAEAGVLALGAVLALATLLATRRMAAQLASSTAAGLAMIFMAVASSLPMDSACGSSTVLATLLVAMSLVRYLDAAPRERWPLPLASAWWAGLAALVHVELLVIWLVLAVHAVVTGPLRRGRGFGLVFPLLRVFSGVLVIGMVMSPALAWNMQTLSVPWPRFPDAPLSLDALAVGTAQGAVTASLQGSGGVVGECYRRALDVPMLQGGWPLLFLILGLGYTAVDAHRDRQRLTGTVGFTLLLVPLFYAGLYPYVGWNAAPAVFASLQPAWAALVALGMARSAITLCRVIKRLAKREIPWLSPGWAASVLAALLALTGVLRNLHAGRTEFTALADVQQTRTKLLETLGEAQPGEHVASDRIGWLAYARPSRYTDVRGRVSPVLLAFQTESGWRAREAADYLRGQNVTRLLTWEPGYRYVEEGFGVPAGTTFPRVSEVP